MGVKKRGGRWHYDFMIKRTRYRGTLPEAQTKNDAKDAEAAVRRDVFEGTFGKPKGDGSFIEYAEQSFLTWSKANKRSWKADECHLAVLKQHFDGKRFREITPMLVEKFKRARLQTPTRDNRQRHAASVNREMACLSKVFSLAIRDGRATLNPCSQVRKYKEHNERNRYLSPEEEARLLIALTGPRAHLKPIIQIAINTGMRRGEILEMRWAWVDFSRGCIHIPGEIAKSGRPRVVPINQLVREVLTDRRIRPGRSELVFTSPKTGERITDFKRGFATAKLEAELSDFHFHDLRHTAATRLADTGADPFVIAEILGHCDLRMTKRYTHATDQRKRQAVEQLAQYNKKAEEPVAPQLDCHKIVTLGDRRVS